MKFRYHGLQNLGIAIYDSQKQIWLIFLRKIRIYLAQITSLLFV